MYRFLFTSGLIWDVPILIYLRVIRERYRHIHLQVIREGYRHIYLQVNVGNAPLLMSGMHNFDVGMHHFDVGMHHF